jgi:predicted chitinase
MIEDASAFYSQWREGFGPLSQNEVEGINALLAEMEARGWTDKRWWAYLLATAWHETASTMQPIAEYGKGKGKPYGKTDPVTGQAYYGRGFVQLTWKENYQRMRDLLDLDLVRKPDLALVPIPAAQIMALGMEQGTFTGKSLGDYFDGDTNDPINARRIVNGTDKAKLIAAYHAKALEAVSAGWGDPKPVDRVAALEAENADLAERVASFEAWAATVNASLDKLENRRA